MIKKINDKIKLNDFFDIFIIAEMSAVLLACLTQSFFDALTPLLHACMYGMLFIYFVFRMYRMILIKQRLDIEFYMLVVFVCISTITMLLDHYSVKGTVVPNFGYLSPHVFTVSTLVLMYIALNSKVSLKTFKTVVLAVCAVSFVYVIFYLFFPKDAYYHFNRISPYLTLGMSNPNKTAVMLFLFFIVMLLGLFVTDNSVFKLIYCITAVMLSVMLYKTLSRTTLLAMLFFVFMMMWLMLKKKYKFSNLIWVGVVFIPILFSALYMLVVNSELFNEFFSFMISDGKGLQSRSKVWGETFAYIKDSPFIGAYYDVNNNLMLTNTHNTHLHIIASYGVIAYVPFILINCLTFVKVNKICSNKLASGAMIAVAGVLVIGIAESTIFSGSTGLFMFLGLFIALIPAMSELSDENNYVLRFLKKYKR